jgi:hypothetical protein
VANHVSKGGSKMTVSAARSSVRCLYCDEEISLAAKVCFHCGRPKRWWMLHHLELASLMGVLLALGLLVLGYLQFQESRIDRIEAAQALKQSKEALLRAALAEAGLERQRKDIDQYSRDLFSSLCKISGGVFQQSTLACQLPDGEAIRYGRVFRE